MFALVEWHRREIDNMRKEMDTIFDRFFKGFFGMETISRDVEPHLDLIDARDRVVLRAEIPGLEAKDLDISLHGDVLTIRGKKRREHVEGQGNFRHMERNYGSFTRKVLLPCLVDADRVEAVYDKGILTVVMPKCQPERPKCVSISVK